MKVIDIDVKGNLIKLYLGADDCEDYWGDDWNDTPYEHNAGPVYNKYVLSTAYVTVSWDYDVLTPGDDWHYNGNSPFCKKDFKEGKAPCIVIAPAENWDTYSIAALDTINSKIYFNQEMEPGNYVYSSPNEGFRKL